MIKRTRVKISRREQISENPSLVRGQSSIFNVHHHHQLHRIYPLSPFSYSFPHYLVISLIFAPIKNLCSCKGLKRPTCLFFCYEYSIRIFSRSSNGFVILPRASARHSAIQMCKDFFPLCLIIFLKIDCVGIVYMQMGMSPNFLPRVILPGFFFEGLNRTLTAWHRRQY